MQDMIIENLETLFGENGGDPMAWAALVTPPPPMSDEWAMFNKHPPPVWRLQFGVLTNTLATSGQQHGWDMSPLSPEAEGVGCDVTGLFGSNRAF